MVLTFVLSFQIQLVSLEYVDIPLPGTGYPVERVGPGSTVCVLGSHGERHKRRTSDVVNPRFC